MIAGKPKAFRGSDPEGLSCWIGTRTAASVACVTREIEPEVQRLRDQALTNVGRSSGRTPIRSALYHLTRGRVDRRPRYTVGQLPTLGTPWQDTVSGRYFGWRCREANLDGRFAFAVEYIVCQHCRAAWVDKPYTAEEYQRKGLASTALGALREENPGMSWFTGSGHMSDARAFWLAIGTSVLRQGSVTDMYTGGTVGDGGPLV